MTFDHHAATFRVASSILAVAGQTPERPSDQAADPSQRSTEFHAVEGGAEVMSGETLLVEAYAALWIILFGFIFVSWRRQSRIDARVSELERLVAQGPGK